MATVLDVNSRKPFSVDGKYAPTTETAEGVKGKRRNRIVFCLGLLAVVTLAVLVVAIIGLAFASRLQLNALLRGSTDLLSYSPVPPKGYSYGGFVITGYRAWVEKTPMLLARSDHAVTTCNDMFYIIGGQVNNNYSAAITSYDPIFETLAVLAPMPVPRTRMPIGCLNNNTIITAGGYDTPDNANNGVPLASTYLYNIQTNVWSPVASMITPRSDTWGAVVNGKFYFIGGYENGYGVSSKNEMFDGTSWTSLAPMPTARGDVGVTTMNGIIYAVGGWNLNGFSAACEAYNPVTNKWTVLASMPAPHGDSAVVVHQGVLHSIGGETFSGKYVPCSYDLTTQCAVNQIPSNDHFVYDEINDYWIEGQPLGVSRFRFAAADGAESLWVFGGATANLVDVALVESLYNTASSYQDPLYYHTLS